MRMRQDSLRRAQRVAAAQPARAVFNLHFYGTFGEVTIRLRDFFAVEVRAALQGQLGVIRHLFECGVIGEEDFTPRSQIAGRAAIFCELAAFEIA